MLKHPFAARYQEVEIKTASAVDLVVLMYDAALGALQQADDSIAAGDIAARARHLNKVSSILTELQATLNFEAGGDISHSLDRLYTYMRNRLFEANLRQDSGAVQEVSRLMSSLRAAWAEVARCENAKGHAGPEKGAISAAAKGPTAISEAEERLSVTA